MKNIFVLTGSSASGKTSIARALLRSFPLEKVVTTTSRSPRPGERNGRDYYFVPKEAFETGIKKEEFWEWISFAGHFYGSAKKEIRRIWRSRKCPLLVIDPQGAFRFKKLWPRQVRVIFLKVGKEELKRRMRERGGISSLEIKERLARFEQDQKLARRADFIVANRQGKLPRAIQRTKELFRTLIAQSESGSSRKDPS